MDDGTRWIKFAVLCAAFIAFLLRLYRLDFVSLRGDESFTVVFVQRTWEGLWRGIRFIEPNPPLMYLALRVWVALAGASEFATRYFSAFFGVLCVPLLYRLAREMFTEEKSNASKKLQTVIARSGSDEASSRAATRLLRPFGARNDTAALARAIALAAAALIAINPYQIWHSQDVRNYTMWPALSLLALIFFWRWWNAERRQTTDDRRRMVLNLSFYVLATTASLYTHYYDTFILVAESIFIFAFALCSRRWRTLRRWIGAQAALALVYVPWVVFGTNRVTTYGEPSAQQSVSLLDVFRRTLATFTLSDTVPDDLKTVVWIPLTLALGVILVYLARQDRARAAFLFLYMAVPALVLYILSVGRPLFLERYLNGIAPAYYLAFAIGLAALWRASIPWKRVALASAILFFASSSAYALTNYYFDPRYAKAPDWRALLQFITAQQRDGDILVQNFNELSTIYYRRGNLTVMTLPRDYRAAASDEKTLRQLNADYRRIWFIPAAPDFWDPERFVERFLERHDDRASATNVSSFQLQLYETPREFEPKMIALNARVGEATLVGYRIRGDAARISNPSTLRLSLYWRAAPAGKIEKDLTVFVHLVDASERVIAQRDNAPVRGTYPTSAWPPGELVVDAYDLDIEALSGAYALVAGMYDPATSARAPAFDANGARLTDDRVTLTQITLP